MTPKPPPGFTSNPQANPPPSFPPSAIPFPNASAPSSSSSSSSSADADPPPPLPANLDAETEAEANLLEAWLRRHEPYITTIRWHRYSSLPALSPLWGYSDVDYRAECLESLLFYTRAAGRKLTDEERDAILTPIARTAVAASYDRPVALGLAIWGMARSWNKSGLRETMRRSAAAATAAAAAAAPSAPIMGNVGADGLITHFSGPQAHQQQHRVGFAGAAGNTGGVVISSLFRRVARTSLVGLSCFAGYQALWKPWRFLLGTHEVESIRHDLCLEKMCHDMDINMEDKMAGIIRKHGGL